MGELTNTHLDELNRMFEEMQANRREHPELYCHHWELGRELFGLLLHASEPVSPSLGFSGMKVEVNPYVPKDMILCMDVVNGERKIVKIIKVKVPDDTTQEAAEAGRLDKTETEETKTQG